MDLNRLRQINEQKAQEQAVQTKHNELLLDNTRTQETIVKSFKALVDYLDNRVSKTAVVNQLTEIATPDAEKVVKAVDSLHQTLRTHENTDLSDVTKLLQEIHKQAKQLPKGLPEYKQIDTTKELKSLQTALEKVEKAIKAQELNVEAPIVNVPEAKITVPKPEVKIVKETTNVTNEITVEDWRKEYVMSDSRKMDEVAYYGHLKTDGSWYIMRHRTSGEAEDFDEEWDEIRYIFGKKDYAKNFKKREGLKYKLLDKARDE